MTIDDIINKSLSIIPKDNNFDYLKIIEDYANGKDIIINKRDFELTQINEGSLLIFCKKYLLNNGCSKIFNMTMLSEDFVKKNTNIDDIKNIFSNFLKKIEIEDEFIIIDPYFYPNSCNEADYLSLIKDIFGNFIPSIKNLTIITSIKFNDIIKGKIENELKKINNSINIIHKTNDDWHDRYWISSKNKKGFMVGTSMNGIGKRHALIDYLTTDDIEEILSNLYL